MSGIMLSIYVPTYNHENYITKALDSILMQETRYTYEVYVGEDCSTDRTREVLKAYEALHPGKFHILYRDHNMHHEIPRNAGDLKRRCKGKYIIALEGDDYWTDPKKIEKQIDFLESHPDYIAVAHDCIVVDENSEPKQESYPGCRDQEYTFRHYISEIMPGQLTTVMYRNMFADDLPQPYDTSVFNKGLMPGDRALYFWLLANGKIFCMHEKMSAYRHVTHHGSSFSANYKYKYAQWETLFRGLLEYAQKINHAEAQKYAEFLCIRNALQGFREKQCDAAELARCWECVGHKRRVLKMYIAFRWNKNIMHKQLWL